MLYVTKYSIWRWKIIKSTATHLIVWLIYPKGYKGKKEEGEEEGEGGCEAKWFLKLQRSGKNIVLRFVCLYILKKLN